MIKKDKVIEICKNLETTISKITKVIIRNENSMFDKPTASAFKLKQKREELINEYGLTKKDLK